MREPGPGRAGFAGFYGDKRRDSEREECRLSLLNDDDIPLSLSLGPREPRKSPWNPA
jgi:hypothetical protein